LDVNRFRMETVHDTHLRLGYRSGGCGLCYPPEAHSDGCCGQCGTNDHDNPPCPEQDYPAGCTCGHVFDEHRYDSEHPEDTGCLVCEKEAPTHWVMCRGYTPRSDA
jgi:hypothetical protein